MNDPIMGKGLEQELFERVARECSGAAQPLVIGVAINLLANVIRQSTPTRKAAEELVDQLFGHAKTLLLEKHYDPVTGLRRTVFPFTQVAQAPFHAEKSKIPT